MVGSHSLLTLVGWGVSVAAAADVVYVTDLSIFTVLAPCAKAAVSGVINYETNSNCPTEAAGLQSCICSKNGGGYRSYISSSISSSLDYSVLEANVVLTCGSTATDDQASAATVLSGYCNQKFITPFPSPSHPVSEYVVDLSAYHNLAPCAQSAVGPIVLGMTWDRCQADASLLATCACQKNQNSQWASQQISTSAKAYCSGHTADVSSALAVFDGYCGLVNGTSSFPTTSDPPGHMTYHITALQQFKALASCAQTAVSQNVLRQTRDLCPSGPKALASCACLRNDMTGIISSSITSDVRYYCNSAGDDIASALNVWDIYCSAAKGLTTPAGITETVSQATSTPQTRTSGAQETSKSSSVPNENTNNNGTTTENSMSMSNTAVIAGAVVGSVVGTALIAVVAFLLYRRSKKAQAAATAPAIPDAGKPELDSTSVAPAPAGSPSPSIYKSRMDSSSPVSAISGAYAPPHMAELHNQAPRTPELQGPDAPSPLSPHEAQSRQVYEAPGQFRPQVAEAHGQPMSELQGMGWQSGPVPHAYEMDASDIRNHYSPPHAQ